MGYTNAKNGDIEETFNISAAKVEVFHYIFSVIGTLFRRSSDGQRAQPASLKFKIALGAGLQINRLAKNAERQLIPCVICGIGLAVDDPARKREALTRGLCGYVDRFAIGRVLNRIGMRQSGRLGSLPIAAVKIILNSIGLVIEIEGHHFAEAHVGDDLGGAVLEHVAVVGGPSGGLLGDANNLHPSCRGNVLLGEFVNDGAIGELVLDRVLDVVELRVLEDHRVLAADERRSLGSRSRQVVLVFTERILGKSACRNRGSNHTGVLLSSDNLAADLMDHGVLNCGARHPGGIERGVLGDGLAGIERLLGDGARDPAGEDVAGILGGGELGADNLAVLHVLGHLRIVGEGTALTVERDLIRRHVPVRVQRQTHGHRGASEQRRVLRIDEPAGKRRTLDRSLGFSEIRSDVGAQFHGAGGEFHALVAIQVEIIICGVIVKVSDHSVICVNSVKARPLGFPVNHGVKFRVARMLREVCIVQIIEFNGNGLI